LYVAVKKSGRENCERRQAQISKGEYTEWKRIPAYRIKLVNSHHTLFLVCLQDLDLPIHFGSQEVALLLEPESLQRGKSRERTAIVWVRGFEREGVDIFVLEPNEGGPRDEERG